MKGANPIWTDMNRQGKKNTKDTPVPAIQTQDDEVMMELKLI